MYISDYSRRRANAKTYPTHCRYCGKKVFYHENEHGSRVFFEALGWPWLKHRCREYLNRQSRNNAGMN